MTSVISRSRWAAVGASAAMLLGVGGIGITHATKDSSAGPVSAYFPIEPCRLAEDVPIGPDSSVRFPGRGASGGCNLPSGVTVLVANVTVVGATEQTNVRVYAADDEVPETANLNPTPGAPPTPNVVDIPLSDLTGEFSVYNRFGTVRVFIDVMGYYDDHTHDEQYYRKWEVNEFMRQLKVAISAGNGEGVGDTHCSSSSLGHIEIAVRTATGEFRNNRFSFSVPEFAYGQVRKDGTIRAVGFADDVNSTLSIERAGTGRYCLVFTGDTPTQAQAESTIASVNFEN